MAINIPGLLAIIFFYLVILVVGIWAGRKTSEKTKDSKDVTMGEQSNIMLAGRNIGLFVGVFTMTATWVGGGYINGTAEVVYTSGLAWCQAPFGYAISLSIAGTYFYLFSPTGETSGTGGYLFAVKMRKAGYKTMLDPFQQHFGNRMGGLLFLPALCGEVFWSAAILAALGATVEVILELQRETSVIVSACIALFYTFTGGLYSVAYTDVVQLGAIFFGLWLCVPYAIFHKAVGPISYPTNDFIGSVDWTSMGSYCDSMLLLMMGGIPWQVYFQRVLSSRTAEGAELLSYMAAFGCLFMAVPPVVIGAVAKASNLTLAGYKKEFPLTKTTAGLTLPLVLQYLTPGFVSAMGLGAVSAAVMSSSDSSILSAASMFAWNIYRLLLRQTATDTEVIWVMRLSIVVVGALATYMALTAESVYDLWFLSSDLVYVILFPQLFSIVYLKDYVNTYGSLAAFIVGSFFRAGGGEKVMHIPAFIRYPYYDEKEDAQRFPFRTFSMIMSFCTLLSVSVLAKWLILDVLSPSADIFKCFVEKAEPLAESRPQNATATRESAISNSQVLNTSARSNSGIKSGKAVSAETMSSGRSAELGSKGENRRSKGENRGSKGGNRGSKGDIRGSKGEKRGSGLSATSEEDRRRPKRRPSSSSRESHKGGRRKKEESRETVTATATEESSTSAAPAARKKSRKGKAT